MIAGALFGAAGLACALVTLIILAPRQAARRDRVSTAIAFSLTAVWCCLVALFGSDAPAAQVFEIFRNIAWICALFLHFANDGRDELLRVVRQVATALVSVELLQFVLLLTEWNGAEQAVSALLRMLVAVGALLLVHNLFGGASAASRRLLAWNSAALALFWLFELNLFTINYLTGTADGGAEALRAIVMIVVAAMFGIGALQSSRSLAFRPSRTVTFSTLSLAAMAGYFITMVGLAKGVAGMAGDLALVSQVGFLLLAAVVAIVWLPSPRLRATARVLALKHLFKHRYDYRAEWLRFTHTIGSAAGRGAPLQERAVQSLADITDSSAGILLVPRDDGDLELAARWHWPTADVPAPAASLALANLLEKHGLIIDLDEVRAGVDHKGEARLVPEWLKAESQAWAVVPLLHGERLAGVVVLARPQISRGLDWEDFDLLGVAGQQIASYLSEQAGHEALQDSARFDEFNRRIAFVMHDIKNLSSQLALLARNAERHAENPAFRADMLVTLRNSADKLDALVSRLGRYGSKSAVTLAPLDLAAMARRLVGRLGPGGVIALRGDTSCEVIANGDLLEQALVHLIQNAIEASEPGAPIALEIASTGLRGTITVVDSGRGMTPQFMRTGLFRPFVSTKENGFGIGVCEAREHVRAMAGRLDVESREGLGSRFAISLPLAAASRILAERGLAAETHPDEKAA